MTICTFVSRVMSLLFKTLPRFVIAFLSRSNHLISCRSHHAQRFITQEEEIYHYFHHFLFYLPCSNGARCHDLSFCFVLFFLIFNFKLALSLSFFTLIKRLFSSSLLSLGVGNGNPLQYSCLENPMDRGLVGYSLWGCKESDTTENTTEHTRMCPGQGGTDDWSHLCLLQHC